MPAHLALSLILSLESHLAVLIVEYRAKLPPRRAVPPRSELGLGQLVGGVEATPQLHGAPRRADSLVVPPGLA